MSFQNSPETPTLAKLDCERKQTSPGAHGLQDKGIGLLGLRVGAQGKIVPKWNLSKCWNKTF